MGNPVSFEALTIVNIDCIRPLVVPVQFGVTNPISNYEIYRKVHLLIRLKCTYLVRHSLEN